MLDLHLEQLAPYKRLRAADDTVSATLTGLLHPIAGDAADVLEYVRKSCPKHTRHNIQHSWTVAERAYSVLSDEAAQSLTPVENFLFLFSAAFHDVGMVQGRAEHPEKSAQIVDEYFKSRLTPIKEYSRRMISCLQFIIAAHGEESDILYRKEALHASEMILGALVRPGLLAVLLRVGDLLDLDSDRAPETLPWSGAAHLLDDDSLIHHLRHKNVTHFYYDSTSIEIDVVASSRREHQIWKQWLGWLEDDIVRANTYLFRGRLSVFRLPVPRFQVLKAPDAKYELWNLRFEIDEAGRLFDLVSQSIYTTRFAFIRELVQNAIDACLYQIYCDPDVARLAPSPRKWLASRGTPPVWVVLFPGGQEVCVADSGIGMNKTDLECFLFRVAESGYRADPVHRGFRFPSIATFGLGFVSVLSRAQQIVISTLKGDTSATRVLLRMNSRDAYVEQDNRTTRGTSVQIILRDQIKRDVLRDDLRGSVRYTSAEVGYCSIDDLLVLLEAEGVSKSFSERIRTEPSFVVEMLVEHGVDGLAREVVKNSLHEGEAIDPRAVARRISKSVGPLSASGLPSLPRVAIVELNSRLGAKKVRISRGSMPASLISEPPIVMEIFASLDDFDLGIEWRSRHAFIVFSNSVVRHVAVMPRRGYLSVEELEEVDYEEEEGYDADERSWDELVAEKERAASGAKWNGLEDEDGLHFLVATSSDILHLGHEWLWDHSLGSLVRVAAKQGRRYLDPEELSDPEGRGKNRGRFAAYDSNAVNLLTVHKDLDGAVFQDGIVVPLKASGLAPIGATYATCNLTAGARLRLNVARNSLDESEGAFRDWYRRCGEVIQRRVWETVKGVFEHYRLSWVDGDLVLYGGNDSALESFCRARLAALIR